jgi:hypothetical protein
MPVRLGLACPFDASVEKNPLIGFLSQSSSGCGSAGRGHQAHHARRVRSPETDDALLNCVYFFSSMSRVCVSFFPTFSTVCVSALCQTTWPAFNVAVFVFPSASVNFVFPPVNE